MASIAFILLGTVAWLIAFCAPPLLAFWFWKTFAKQHGKIAAHLLFAPSAIASEWASVWVVGFAAHDNGDGPPGLGFLLIPPFATFLFSVIGYYCCAVYDGAMTLWRRANGS